MGLATRTRWACAALRIVPIAVCGCQVHHDTTRGNANSVSASAEPLYRATKRVEGAIAVGVTYARFGELLQDVQTEWLILADHIRTPADTLALRRYGLALDDLKDSYAIWASELKMDDNDTPGGGRGVWVVMDGDQGKALLAKRHIPGSDWHGHTLIEASWIQKLWDSAAVHTLTADSAALGPYH